MKVFIVLFNSKSNMTRVVFVASSKEKAIFELHKAAKEYVNANKIVDLLEFTSEDHCHIVLKDDVIWWNIDEKEIDR